VSNLASHYTADHIGLGLSLGFARRHGVAERAAALPRSWKGRNGAAVTVVREQGPRR